MHRAKRIPAIIVSCFPPIFITYPSSFFLCIKFSDPPATNGCCHYIDGNVYTEERMDSILDAMKLLGLEGRVHLEWVSAKLEDRSSRRRSPGFVERIRALGPSPLRAE